MSLGWFCPARARSLPTVLVLLALAATSTTAAADPGSDRRARPRPDAAQRSAAEGQATGWLAQAQAAIAAGEYFLAPGEGARGWTAPNRANGLRPHWRDGVMALGPRLGDADWGFEYELVGVGRLGTPLAAPPALAFESVEQGRLEWHREGGLVEWYVNDRRGIEQGFTLAEPPAGRADAPLAVEGRIGGLLAYPDEAGQSALLRTPDGRLVLQVRDLVVTDARGEQLPACLEAGPGTLTILVDDRGAVYPVTVDPLFASPGWMVSGHQEGASFGWSMATAGDVNGDGYSDVIVGAASYDAAATNTGKVFVYHGSAGGLSTTPAWTIDGEGEHVSLGESVATAGDVNGDGYSDVVVGEPSADQGGTNAGRVHVYHGSPTGLASTPARTVTGSQADAWFGQVVSPAGDVNGDGYADVLVCEPYADHGEEDEGRAYVYHGSPTGLASTPAWTAEGNQFAAYFGWSAAMAGDVNGDGYWDVVVAATDYNNGQVNEGRVYAYHGSATGLSSTAAWTAESDVAYSYFGWPVAPAGDVNGDGYADVMVGAGAQDGVDEGKAFVYHGSATGLAATPAWTAEGDQAGAAFGSALSTAGDVNGDGYADIVVGAWGYDGGQADEGRTFVYLGSQAGLSATPAWTVESDQEGARGGLPVATAGDVNGDGFSDVLSAASYWDDEATDSGSVSLYLGSASGPGTAAAWSAAGAQAGEWLGYSVATAGDVNGDGYSDVVVGAWGYDGGGPDTGRALAYLGSASGLSAVPAWTAVGTVASAHFGISVGTAGDVNGDGYEDVIVGADTYTNGEVREGAAFVFLGSATGLAASPSWSAESNQAEAGFGLSVGTAGDVNGDGFADVIVGAPSEDGGQRDEGRVRVYHGSATGLGTTPAWMAEGDQEEAAFGYWVSKAGDVNRDGYSDIVIGAYGYDNGETNEGAAFVYHGSPAGIGTSAAWVGEGNKSEAWLGSMVGTAGDVNGDGYSDVIVSAAYSTSDQTEEGAAFVYHGSPTGLSATPAWTAEGNQEVASFGDGSTAGDVNGDGYSDLIVGAWAFDNGQVNEGRAFLYLGSASGLGASPAWTAELNEASANFGWPVGTAGDVNGDGFSDVVVGCWLCDAGATDSGAAFVYYGNGGDGVDRTLRQLTGDGIRQLAPLARVADQRGFRMYATMRSPFGRDRVRLELQLTALGEPFSATAPFASDWYLTLPPAADGSILPVAAVMVNTGLEGPVKWRVRVRGRSPYGSLSPWGGMPGNALTEQDLRLFADADLDGVADASDNCPAVANADQANDDADGRGNACDNCPSTTNAGQEDRDADSVGDACDACTECPGFDVDLAAPTILWQLQAGELTPQRTCLTYRVPVKRSNRYRFTLCEGGGSTSAAVTVTVTYSDGVTCNDACTAPQYGCSHARTCGMGSDVAFDPGYDGFAFVKVTAAAGDAATFALAYTIQEAENDCALTAPNVGPLVPTTEYQTHSAVLPSATPFWGGRSYTFEVQAGTGYYFTLCATDPAGQATGASTTVTRAQGLGSSVPHCELAPAGVARVNCDQAESFFVQARETGLVQFRLVTRGAGGSYTLAYKECGPSTDGDAVCDALDNCPAVSNASQADADGDRAGDACDACPNDAADDADGDGRCADVDNCPQVANAGQENADGDALGDACDPCPNDTSSDSDGDAVCDSVDNCPAARNPVQDDADDDGVGDACDNCVDVPNAESQPHFGLETGTAELEDISATGTAGPSGDEGMDEIDIGFTFKHYGSSFTKAHISANGLLVLGPPDSADGDTAWCCSNPCIPSAEVPNHFIAPLWFDLLADPGELRYEVRGTAPHRRLIVQWTDVGMCCAPGSSGLTFQAILYEGTDRFGLGSDEFEFRYSSTDVVPTGDYGELLATIGTESGTGANGVPVSCQAGPPETGTSYAFRWLQLDPDRDGLADACDNCPVATNADQADDDTDGRGNPCDNCPVATNADQADDDTDGRGNPCDNCLLFANADQGDDDTDGLGDACEFAWGDTAPAGAPDGALTAADVVRAIILSHPLGSPTHDEMKRANVAPASVVGASPAVATPTLAPPLVIDGDDADLIAGAVLGRTRFTAPR